MKPVSPQLGYQKSEMQNRVLTQNWAFTIAGRADREATLKGLQTQLYSQSFLGAHLKAVKSLKKLQKVPSSFLSLQHHKKLPPTRSTAYTFRHVIFTGTLLWTSHWLAAYKVLLKIALLPPVSLFGKTPPTACRQGKSGESAVHIFPAT